MERFGVHRGKAAILDWSDVNTDLIIPARYLKRIERTGYGSLLFADKRYVPGGAPEADEPQRHGPAEPGFPLNRPEADGATILVVGRNFGCGSSREHAVWAVAQAGFRVMIAPGKGEGFADIFKGNSFNNGLLPIELDPADWVRVAEAIRDGSAREVVVDLERTRLIVERSDGSKLELAFEVPEAQRHRLLNGLDAIGETLSHAEAIDRHEEAQPEWSMSGK